MPRHAPLAALAALLLAGAPSPAPAQTPKPEATAEVQVTAKVGAYVKAQNGLVTFNAPSKDLAEYLRTNDKLSKPGKLAYYWIAPGNYDGTIEQLTKAKAMPGSVPALDVAAERLRLALEDLTPTMKALVRHKATDAYKEDGGKFAREQGAIYVGKMTVAAEAEEAFADGLFAHELARDEARYAALPEGTLRKDVLGTSLASRRVVRLSDKLVAGADPAPFRAATDALAKSNEALHGRLDALGAKADDSCKTFASSVDDMVGNGRRLVRDITGRGNPKQAYGGFVDYYNRAVDAFPECEESAKS